MHTIIKLQCFDIRTVWQWAASSTSSQPLYSVWGMNTNIYLDLCDPNRSHLDGAREVYHVGWWNILHIIWYCMDCVSFCNIYVIQQGAQYLMIKFIHNVQ